jgi:hypothetical protein
MPAVDTVSRVTRAAAVKLRRRAHLAPSGGESTARSTSATVPSVLIFVTPATAPVCYVAVVCLGRALAYSDRISGGL